MKPINLTPVQAIPPAPMPTTAAEALKNRATRPGSNETKPQPVGARAVEVLNTSERHMTALKANVTKALLSHDPNAIRSNIREFSQALASSSRRASTSIQQLGEPVLMALKAMEDDHLATLKKDLLHRQWLVENGPLFAELKFVIFAIQGEREARKIDVFGPNCMDEDFDIEALSQSQSAAFIRTALSVSNFRTQVSREYGNGQDTIPGMRLHLNEMKNFLRNAQRIGEKRR